MYYNIEKLYNIEKKTIFGTLPNKLIIIKVDPVARNDTDTRLPLKAK